MSRSVFIVDGDDEALSELHDVLRNRPPVNTAYLAAVTDVDPDEFVMLKGRDGSDRGLMDHPTRTEHMG